MYKLRGWRDGFNIGLTYAHTSVLDLMTEGQFLTTLKEENLQLTMEAKETQPSKYMGVVRQHGTWHAHITISGQK